MNSVNKYRAVVLILVCVMVFVAGITIAVAPVSAQSDTQDESGEQTEQTEEEEQFQPFESGTIHEFPNGAELRYVEFSDGEATIYIYLEQSLTNERAEVSSAVASSGVVPTTRVSLEEGENVITVQLQDESVEGVSVASGGQSYAYLGEDNRITISQDVPYPWVLSALGMLLVFLFVVAFNQFRKRRSKSAKNAIKT